MNDDVMSSCVVGEDVSNETCDFIFFIFFTVHHSRELFYLPTLTLNLLTTTIVVPPSNASKWQIGFNLAFKGLMHISLYINKCMLHYYPRHVSSINMPIFRRTNCIHTAFGIVALELSERSYINKII